jgi:hypothetical protein
MAGSVNLFAQEARLNGTVSDPTGSVIPGAKITATQTERNVAFDTASDAVGRYLFPRLPIGTYTIRAEVRGFQTFVQSDVRLTTNADALLNIEMQVGEVEEQITVSGEVSRVSTETSTIQQLVDTRRIVELPLNGRNVYHLAALVPGTGQSGLNIGGGRTGSQNTNMVNVRLDGNLNVNTAYGDILPSPSPDAVQEFTVQTNVPSARYGWASGVVEVSTRSGTNELHGSLYNFLRNDALDARNFFLPTKTKRKRNQYGVVAGGPLYLPRLYDGRNKTFWFANFEQQKEALGAPVTIFVPTEAQLRGDFSGVGRTIRDPENNQAFPGNIIPQSRLDPLALNFSRRFVPAAQEPSGLYRYQTRADNNPTSLLIRADQVIASRHQLSAQAFITRREGPLAAGNLPAFQSSRTVQDTDFVGTSHTWTVSPNKINTLRYGFNSNFSNQELFPKISDEELRQIGWSPNFRRYNDNSPSINVSGFFQASQEFSTLRDYRTHSWSNDFSWIVGPHNLMMGTDGMYTIQEGYSVSRTHGLYTFSGAFSGLALSDFFLGLPNTLRQGNPAVDRTLGLHMGWYVQDDLKVSKRVTLNLGLRYELPLPTWSDLGQAAFWRPGQKSQVYPNAPVGYLFPGDQGLGNSGYDGKKNYWAPRVGLAYALTADQKSVLRAGYGIYYAPSWTNIIGQFQIYQPFIRIIDRVAPPTTADPWAGYPGGNPHPYDRARGAVFDQQIAGLAYGPNYREPMMQQWSLGLQREFARNFLATVSYVGTRGKRIPYLRDMNPAVYIPGQSTVANTNQRRPLYPDFARFSIIESVVNSNYNSLQASLDRRFSDGLTVLVSYTFSKALTDLNNVLTNDGGVPDPNNRRLEWGPADHDRTHAFVTSWVWMLPFGSGMKGARKVLLGGWEVNGIWSMYSGGPLAFVASQDRALRGQPNRPDRLRDARLELDRPRKDLIAQYFDTSAYAPNGTGQFGTAPRAEGQLRGPGSVNLTLGINKRLRALREDHSLQFRTEIFNLPNRPNFNNPGTNIDSPAAFGRITSAADGRIIQFGLKYLF